MGASRLANDIAFLTRCAGRLLPLLICLAACDGGRPEVIVIGGGPAGMAAAIEAAATSDVVLVEGASDLGGSARYGAAITVVGGAGLPADYEARVQRDVLDWTRSVGVRWVPALNPLGDGRRLMRPEADGQGLAARLAARVRSAGVVIRMGVRASGLEREGRWRVNLADGTHLEGDAVVVATGGFMGALARVRRVLGQPSLVVSAPPFSDGAGEDWLTGAGATVTQPRRAIVYGHAIRHPADPERAVMVVDAPGAWIVDSEGRTLARRVVPRGGIDVGSGPRFMVVRGADIDDIKLLDPLEDTWLDARAAIPTNGWLAPDGSIGAFALVQTGAKSLTGVVTDAQGRVLDGAGAPIPGLFAAGEVAGFGGGAHPAVDNTMVAAAILSGRAAGKAIGQSR